MKIAVGAVLYYWPREALLDFYARIAASAADVVYVGEAVCSRRHALRLDDWLALARDLAAAGKEVVLSTQALIESESDLRTMRRIAANGEFAVEANEMGAVRALHGCAQFVAGPHLNVYNGETLAWLAELGARRWVLPVELSRAALAGLQRSRPEGVETEVFAWGKLPLAFSARCFTARHYDLPKDDCRFRCLEHPDGLALETRDGRPFLTLNGIQTQSAQVYDLAPALGELRELGVDVVRLSPQSAGTEEVVGLFRAAIDGAAGRTEVARALAALAPMRCNGYWHGVAGIEYREAP